MKTILLGFVSLFIAPSLLWAAEPADIGPPAPRDEAGFFSVETLKVTADRVRHLQAKYQLPVVIETYKAIPEARKKDVDLLDVRTREKLFADWAQERLQAVGNEGVALLICKETTYIYMAVGERTRQKLVTSRDRRGMVSILISRFVDRQFDDGLRELLYGLEEVVKSNLEKPPRVAGDGGERDELGAGGEAAASAVVGPRIRIAGVTMRGVRDITPAPPPPTVLAANEVEESGFDLLGSRQLVIGLVVAAGAAGLLALVLAIVRRMRRAGGQAAAVATPATGVDS